MLVISTVVRFSSESLAWSFAKRIAAIRSFRISDYGFNSELDSVEPYYIKVDQLQFADTYSAETLSRWKASGKLS